MARATVLSAGACITMLCCAAILAADPSPESPPADPARDEAKLRDRFMKDYWDIVSDNRLAALDILKGATEDKSLWTLYAVSYWDYEPRVRRRAFSMLADTHDALGYVSYLAARSFRLEPDEDVLAWKAEAMRELDFKWEPLNELVGFMVRQKYPRYGYPYGYHGGWAHGWGWGCPWHGARFAACRGHTVCRGTWRAYGSCGVGGIAVGFGTDWETVKDNRRRLTTVLEAINYLASTDFKLRSDTEDTLKKWWAVRSSEFQELDRRTRLGREEARRERERAKKELQDIEEQNREDLQAILNGEVEIAPKEGAAPPADKGKAKEKEDGPKNGGEEPKASEHKQPAAVPEVTIED